MPTVLTRDPSRRFIASLSSISKIRLLLVAFVREVFRENTIDRRLSSVFSLRILSIEHFFAALDMANREKILNEGRGSQVVQYLYRIKKISRIRTGTVGYTLSRF